MAWYSLTDALIGTIGSKTKKGQISKVFNMTIILHKKAQKHTYHDKLQLTVKYSMEVMIFLTRKGPIWVFLPSCEI